MTEEVILGKPEEKRLDESLNGFRGEEGAAPEGEELAALPEELPSGSSTGFSFTREGAREEGSTFFEEVDEQKTQEWYEDGEFMSLVGPSLAIVSILIFTLFYLTFSEGNIKTDLFADKEEVHSMTPLDESYDYSDTAKIDGVIQKANTLCLKGEAEQALDIYAQVTVYDEALPNYNLDVLQMNEDDFKTALESFKRAISNGESQSVSAINAAVCALKLNDEEKFHYYISLAEIYLLREGKSKLHEYYLSLANYYKGYYPEALQILQKAKIEPYADTAKYLSAKIYAKVDLDKKTTSELTTQGSFESNLSLGLLCAGVGKYNKARGALETAMKIERDFNASLATLTFVDLKTGRL